MVHDRIADKGDLQDLARVDPGLGRDLLREARDRLADGLGHLPVAAGVHHHVRDPAHQILAEPDLRVHQSGRGDDLAAGEIAEVPRDRG